MKRINWKLLSLTCAVTLSPILLGLAVYHDLPERIAIHWGLYGEANGWAGRAAAVFGLPVLMALLQVFCCAVTDLKRTPGEKLPKLICLTVWLIPALSVVLYSVTMAVALGSVLDIRLVVCLIVGFLFLAMGNYFPKIPYSSRYLVNTPGRAPDERTWRKFSRAMGVVLMADGALVLVSMLFSPVVSAAAIALLAVGMAGLAVYGRRLAGKAE